MTPEDYALSQKARAFVTRPTAGPRRREGWRSVSRGDAMTVTADDLTVAFVDFALVLVSDAKDERNPVGYLHDRLLDMRGALVKADPKPCA